MLKLFAPVYYIKRINYFGKVGQLLIIRHADWIPSLCQANTCGIRCPSLSVKCLAAKVAMVWHSVFGRGLRRRLGEIQLCQSLREDFMASKVISARQLAVAVDESPNWSGDLGHGNQPLTAAWFVSQQGATVRDESSNRLRHTGCRAYFASKIVIRM